MNCKNCKNKLSINNFVSEDGCIRNNEFGQLSDDGDKGAYGNYGKPFEEVGFCNNKECDVFGFYTYFNTPQKE